MLRATIALIALFVLTGAFWLVGEQHGSPALFAGIAALKAAIIGAVFLELDRSHPMWAGIAALLVIGVLAGAVVLMG